MVTLPEIKNYSYDQIEELKTYSPISDRYIQLLDTTPATLADEIRILKHHHWLKCALATIHGTATSEKICQYWTQETDLIIKKAWRECDLPESEALLLAFGKLGSCELNLSSDIDIVLVKSNDYEDSKLNVNIRNFIKLLSENTKFGFAYRVDLDLRPGGPQAPLISNKAYFYNFYDEYLEAWHRLSFIRLRSLFSGSKLEKDILSYCKKRCFPKRLDFSVINEIKNIRSKINFQWRKSNEPFDIKLHPGGIRDIELYVHSLQVIYGGRNPKVQISGLSEAIENLKSCGALPDKDAHFLLDFYWQLRQIENLIHIKADQHTYLLPNDFFEKDRTPELTEKDLMDRLELSSQLISDFFTNEEHSTKERTTDSSMLDKHSLKAIEEIKDLKSPLIKKQKIDGLKNDILDQFLSHTQKIDIDGNLAIQLFKDFIFSIKSKTSIFHLLSRHPGLLEDLAWMFSISPMVGQILCQRPELIDSFALGQVEFGEEDDIEALWENLLDYKLLGHLNATVEFIKKRNLNIFLTALSNQADFIVKKLQNFLSLQFEAEPLEILCMGKWSGYELGIKSDLDFVFLSEKEANQPQIKMARRLINLLTSHSMAGRLYDIDLRLKPNQSAGPLIVEKEKLYDFLENKAEGWQKLAYLRSRILGQNTPFLSDRLECLRIKENDVADLEEILSKLLKTNQSKVDLKYAPGGLLHTEFKTQMICLSGMALPSSNSTSHIIQSLEVNEDIKTKVIQQYSFLRELEQLNQICNQSTSTKVSINDINQSRIQKIMGIDDLANQITTTLQSQRKQLKDLDLNC